MTMPTFEPVAWLHKDRTQSDVITDEVRMFLLREYERWKFHSSVQRQQVCKAEHYTAPLFTESQLQQAYEAGLRDAVPEWISVEERLPVLHKGYSEDCLVITNFGNRLISRYDSYSKSWSLYQHEDHIVTLWMTLLAAPKGEKE